MKKNDIILALICLLTLMIFSFLIMKRSESIRSMMTILSIVMSFAPILILYMEFERIHSSSRMVALIAVLVASNVVLRQVMHGVGASPIFFLVLLTGYVFGAVPGFVLGSATILVSNFFVGGHGPWSLLQMASLGFFGFFAAYLPKNTRHEISLLAVYGFLGGFFYGFSTDIFTWLFFFTEYTFSTYFGVAVRGLGFNMAYAVGNVFFITVLGPPVLKVFKRFNKRFTLHIQ